MMTFRPLLAASLVTALSAAWGQTILPGSPLETQSPVVWDFESDPPGLPPADWEVADTGDAAPPALCVVVDVAEVPEGSRALSIQPHAQATGTNQVVAMQGMYRNLELTARMRADAGSHEQGGGLIWRWRDPNNYYVCRYNAMTGEFGVSKVVRGLEQQLDTTDAAEMQWEGLQLAMAGAAVLAWDGLAASSPVESPSPKWLTLRVTMVGPEITCYLNGERKLTAWDEEFPLPGLVGLWTRADAATTFDDVQVTPLD